MSAQRWDDPQVATDLDERRHEQHWFTKAEYDEARGEDRHERDVAGF